MSYNHIKFLLLILLSGPLLNTWGQNSPVQLGRTSNLYSLLQTTQSMVTINDDLDIVAFIHPQDINVWGGTSYQEGYLRYDLSLDQGATFVNDVGPLQSNYQGKAIAPSIASHVPVGISNPFGSQLVFSSSLRDSSGAVSGGLRGVSEVNTMSPAATEHYDLNSNAAAVAAMTSGAQGEFWQVEHLANGPLLSDTIRLYKGVWNATTEDVDWSVATNIVPNWNTSFDGTIHASPPNIAFSPNGQDGWIGLLGDLVGGADSVISPIFIHSSDGGATWGTAVEMDMQTVHSLDDSLQAYHTDSIGLPLATGIGSCAPDFDLTVDAQGHPHLLAVVGSASTQNNPTLGYRFEGATTKYLIDFYEMSTAGVFNGHLVSPLIENEFELGSTVTITMSNYPQIARSSNGENIFYTWVDDDTLFSSAGSGPDLFYAAWRITDQWRICPQPVTTGDFIWDGRAVCPQMAPEVFLVQGQSYYHLPVVMMDMIFNRPDMACQAYYFGNDLEVDQSYFLPAFQTGQQCLQYCSYYTGGDFPGLSATVSGTVWEDDNGNGIQDGAELGKANVILTANDNDFIATDSNGAYFFDIPGDTANEIKVLPSQYLTQTFPSPQTSHSINIAPGTSLAGQDFGLQKIQNVSDIQVVVISTPQRPGFSHHQTIQVANLGNAAASGQLAYRYDAPLNFLSANPAVVASNGTDSLFWNFNLQPGQTAQFKATFDLPAATPLGTMTLAIAYAEDQGGELLLDNNRDTLSSVVIGSYDPNDKQVSPGGIVAPGSWLTYTIRFQNTGTASAINVKVVDALRLGLDKSSFEMIAASHPYRLEVNGNMQVAWYFDQINLPDSTTDEANSHGFIQFRIKTIPVFPFYPPYNGLPFLMHNNAGIYFDFNAPIVTNTVETVLDVLELVVDPESGWGVVVYPNPSESFVQFNIEAPEKGAYGFELYDLQGRLLRSIQGLEGDAFRLDRDGLPAGIYAFRMGNHAGNIASGKLIFR